jgi:PTS system mannose-specific IIA component
LTEFTAGWEVVNVAGIVLISHGNLAAEMRSTLEIIMGPQRALMAVGLQPGEGEESLEERIAAAISRVDDGMGVLLFVDLFGGTPFNTCLRLISSSETLVSVDIIAGMNLPMVMAACTYSRGRNLAELVNMVKEEAKRGIKVYSDLRVDNV